MTQAADPPHELGARDALDVRRRRILFRATHRGMHEADLLLGGYVAPRLAAMTGPDLDGLEEILELTDADLVDWMLGRTPVPAHAETPLLRAILQAAQERDTP